MFVAIKVDSAGIPIRENIVVFDNVEDLNTFIDSQTEGYWKVFDAVRYEGK